MVKECCRDNIFYWITAAVGVALVASIKSRWDFFPAGLWIIADCGRRKVFLFETDILYFYVVKKMFLNLSPMC